MKKLVQILVLLSLTGCAVTARMHANRMDPPESRAEGGEAYLGVGFGGANNVRLTSDFTERDAELEEPPITRTDAHSRIEGAFSIARQLELNIRFHFLITPKVQLKYQLFGAPHEEAEAGNFSGAISAGFGASAESHSGTGFFTTNISSFKFRTQLYDTAFILGFRPTHWLLLYGGPFYNRFFIAGIREITSSGEIIHADDFKTSATNFGTNLALMFSPNKVFSLTLEGVWMNSKSRKTNKDLFHPGLMLSFYF